MKILISIFVLLISFNLNAQELHCDELSSDKSFAFYPNLQRFYILKIDSDSERIASFQFEYNSEYKNKYPKEVREFFLNKSFNYLKQEQEVDNLMSKPIYQGFKIIRRNRLQINAINTSTDEFNERGRWLNLNLISGYGVIDGRRIKCELIEFKNIIGEIFYF